MHRDATANVPLPDPPNPPLEQLARDATPQELVEAAARNHVSWFGAEAAAAGGETHAAHGMAFVYVPAVEPGAPGEVTLAFPRLDGGVAGKAIDAALAGARRRNARQVACWSLLPTEPPDLAARLVARGFQWGWQPHWMGLDLLAQERGGPPEFSLPDGLHVALDDVSDWDVDDLPYYERAHAPRFQALARQSPRRTYHFGAWLGDRVVGHSLLHVSEGPLGVGGVYAVGVVPGARRQGVGGAVSLAACQYARALGCRYVLLNAATHIYERLGFASLGSGQTWWMHRPALEAPPPSSEEVDFAEAVGRGDADALNVLPTPADLDAALPCSMTPLEIAARLGQPGSAAWLLERGATPDVIPLCDLGWRDRVPAALAADPDLANRRLGEWGVTPLHEAAARGDVELARMLLAADPDPSSRDARFNGTPLDWARHLGREEIVRLIEASS